MGYLNKYFNLLIRFLRFMRSSTIESKPIIAKPTISDALAVEEHISKPLVLNSATPLQPQNALFHDLSINHSSPCAHLVIVSKYKPNPLGLQTVLDLCYSPIYRSIEKQ